MLYLSYQVAAFWTSPLFRERADEGILSIILKQVGGFIDLHPGMSVFLIVAIAIVGLAYLMLPVFTQGALIHLLTLQRAGQKISIMQGFSYGFTRFLQLFEYHLVVKTFSFVGVFTEAAFVLRNLGPDAFQVFYGFLFWFLLWEFFSLCSSPIRNTLLLSIKKASFAA